MPVKFDIYVDNKATNDEQPAPTKPRFIPDTGANQRFHFDEKKLYPADGGEFSFEELNYISWLKKRRVSDEKSRVEKKNLQLHQRNEELLLENEELRDRIEDLLEQLAARDGPVGRQSIVPQSLQPSDVTCQYGAIEESPSVVNDIWRRTGTVNVNGPEPQDKFTVPIDQSGYIRENLQTSTPSTKDKRNRRMSRPSMGGSPTMKLTPIRETSRDCNSKSSSSSPGTAKKISEAMLTPGLEAIVDDILDVIEGLEKVLE